MVMAHPGEYIIQFLRDKFMVPGLYMEANRTLVSFNTSEMIKLSSTTIFYPLSIEVYHTTKKFMYHTTENFQNNIVKEYPFDQPLKKFRTALKF
jgi:hypothetical protein